MDFGTSPGWWLIGGIAFASLVMILKVVGGFVQRARDVHDIRVRAHTLRLQYLRRMGGEDEIIEVSPVDDEPEIKQAA